MESTMESTRGTSTTCSRPLHLPFAAGDAGADQAADLAAMHGGRLPSLGGLDLLELEDDAASHVDLVIGRGVWPGRDRPSQ